MILVRSSFQLKGSDFVRSMKADSYPHDAFFLTAQGQSTHDPIEIDYRLKRVLTLLGPPTSCAFGLVGLDTIVALLFRKSRTSSVPICIVFVRHLLYQVPSRLHIPLSCGCLSAPVASAPTLSYSRWLCRVGTHKYAGDNEWSSEQTSQLLQQFA